MKPETADKLVRDNQHPIVLRVELNGKEAGTARLALVEFMWNRFDRYQEMAQKGFRFSDGKEPTPEQIEKAWDQHKQAEKLWAKLNAMRIPTQNVRVLAEARFGADSQEPLVRPIYIVDVL
jgi:hypothetical protein